MRMLKQLRRVLSLLVCVSLLCAGPISPFSLYASLDEDYDDEYQDESDDWEDEDDANEPSNDANSTIRRLQQEIEQVNNKLENVQGQQKQLESALSNAKTEKDRAVVVRDNYGQQIGLTESEIVVLAERISLLEEEIGLRENRIADKQDEIDYNYYLFKRRLRSKYMQDNGTSLGLLLGTDSFAEFLSRTEYMVRIGQHDQDLMETLTRERVAIEGEKAELESTVELVEADKQTTEDRKQQLSQLYSEASLQVHDFSEMEKAFNADLEKNKAMQAAMKAEIDKLYRELEFSKNPYAGGVMAWPLPGYTTISSRYGSRFGGSDFHTGTDITGTGCMGATIVAANDGIVAFTNYGSYGYGIYVMLDHGVNDKGQSVSTLYAHCSALLVNVGDTVQRGDPIAKCGSTGWSTGPHLHFEVRLNGNAVDSLPYIS